jgi:alpha-beta hydrolase superfamily lysophospholipase
LADSAPAAAIEVYTASDGYRCHYRRYPPCGAAKGQVVYVHGIQSHGGWYEYSSARLAQEGWAVSFLDRRGAGLNEEARGDAPSFRRLLDDLAEFLAMMRAGQEPLLPVFLVAISWGGKLAVALERRHPGLVDGLALLCPGLFPKVRPPWKQRLAIAASRLPRPRRLFPIPLSDPVLFTANVERQQFIREDAFSLRQATARFLVESVRLDAYLRRAARYVKTPVLLMLAEHDRIIDNWLTRRYVEQFAAEDRQIIEYTGTHHTLEFEPEPEFFVRDLATWLERQRSALLVQPRHSQ